MTADADLPVRSAPSAGLAGPAAARARHGVPAAVQDGRLVPAAVAAWLATFAALGWSGLTGCLLGAVALVVAVASLAARCRWAVSVAVVGAGAGAALLVTGMRVAARDASPLAALAAGRANAALWLTVRDDPRPLTVRGTGAGGPEVAVPARADRLVAGGRTWRLSAQVLVLAPTDGWAGLLPSQRVLMRGRLGQPLGTDLTAAVVSTRAPPAAVIPPSWPQRAAGRLRAGLRAAAGGLAPGPAGLIPGLTVGDTSMMDPVLAADFRTAGLSHLVAVSGTNVTIVVGAVLLLLRGLGFGPRLVTVGGAVALVGFVLLVRPSPSVLRAAAMGGITLLALALGRRRAVLPALAASVLGLLLWQPELARSPGFALSAAATAGLVLLAPGWSAALRRRGVPVGLAEAAAVCAAAFAVTAPLLAALGGVVSLVTVPANMFAAPAVAPATVLGLVAAVLSPVSGAAAHATAWLAGLPAGWIVGVAERAATAPDAALPWPSGRVGGAALVVLLVLVVVAVRLVAVRRVVLAAAVGALLVWLPVRGLAPGWPPQSWLMVACDVGQGDAIVVHVVEDTALVVDSGPDPVAVDGCLRRLGVRRIPLLLLTHLHADHVDGLPGVLHGRQVGAIAVGPLHQPGWAWRLVVGDAGAGHIPLLATGVGQVREVAGVRLEVLAPQAPFRGTRSDPNNSSVVLRVWTRGHTLLLTGDVEVEAQRALLADRPEELTAEVLKVPHHGSAYSDASFLAAVHAGIGIISVGAHNDYGHPSPLLLAELARLGIRTLRTDTNGDVAVCDHGGRLMVSTRSRGPPS